MFSRLLIIAFFLVSSCSRQMAPSHESAIIGENGLQKTRTADPRLGLLSTGDRDCNAFLVGPTEVMTALHCVGDDPYSFVGYQYQSATGAKSNLVDIIFLDDRKDSIIYRTEKQFPRHFAFGTLLPNEPLRILAFDHELRAQVEAVCRAERILPKFASFAHTCDTKPKFSGAPLIQHDLVVGMHLGTATDESVNYAFHIAKLHNDEGDTGLLSEVMQFEWLHVRSPHIRMDTPKIPLPPLLPSSGYAHWGLGGGSCGSSKNRDGVPDHWGIPGQLANFEPACKEHDNCYKQQLGKDKCDEDFRARLKDICNDSFRNDIFTLQRTECREVVSEVYYHSVRSLGSGPYNDCADGDC